MREGGEDLVLSELSDILRGVLDLLRAAWICAFSLVSSNWSSLNCRFLKGMSFFSMSSAL